MQNRGVIYCATSQIVYLESALISAIALRQLNPELPITLVCDQLLTALLPLDKYGITLLPVALSPKSDTFRSRDLKTRLANISPYPETLYLDADILPIRPLTQIWDYLDKGDMAMVLDRQPTIEHCDHIASCEKTYTLNLLPPQTPQYNSGVMLWRQCEATQTLFTQWQQEWRRFQRHDQLALVRAIAKSQTPIVHLPRHYNLSPIDAEIDLPDESPYLLHCWGGQVTAGAYRQIAQRVYPEIVSKVQTLLSVMPQENLTPCE